jgi:hypothetical protein
MEHDEPQFSHREQLKEWYSARVGSGPVRGGDMGALLSQTGIPCYTCLRMLYGTDSVHNTIRSTGEEKATLELHHRPAVGTSYDPAEQADKLCVPKRTKQLPRHS